MFAQIVVKLRRLWSNLCIYYPFFLCTQQDCWIFFWGGRQPALIRAMFHKSKWRSVKEYIHLFFLSIIPQLHQRPFIGLLVHSKIKPRVCVSTFLSVCFCVHFQNKPLFGHWPRSREDVPFVFSLKISHWNTWLTAGNSFFSSRGEFPFTCFHIRGIYTH